MTSPWRIIHLLSANFGHLPTDLMQEYYEQRATAFQNLLRCAGRPAFIDSSDGGCSVKVVLPQQPHTRVDAGDELSLSAKQVKIKRVPATTPTRMAIFAVGASQSRAPLPAERVPFLGTLDG